MNTQIPLYPRRKGRRSQSIRILENRRNRSDIANNRYCIGNAAWIRIFTHRRISYSRRNCFFENLIFDPRFYNNNKLSIIDKSSQTNARCVKLLLRIHRALDLFQRQVWKTNYRLYPFRVIALRFKYISSLNARTKVAWLIISGNLEFKLNSIYLLLAPFSSFVFTKAWSAK